MAQTEHNTTPIPGTNVNTKAPDLPSGTGAAKIYHTRFPGSTFCKRGGDVVFFRGDGILETTDLELQAELDLVADKAGSPIYTKDKPVLEYADVAPAEDNKVRAAAVIAKLHASQQKSQG